MTPEELRAKLVERRADHAASIVARDKAIALLDKEKASLAQFNAISTAHIEEIDFALEQLPASPEAQAAALVAAEKPAPEKSPRERCADEIEAAGIWADGPLDAEEIHDHFSGRFNPRTVRAALNLIHERRQKSRAAEQGGNNNERTDAGGSPSSPPESCAGPIDPPSIEPPVEEPDILPFLDKRKAKIEAEAEASEA